MEISDAYRRIIQQLEDKEIGSERFFEISKTLAIEVSDQFGSIKGKASQEYLISAAVFRDIGKLKIDNEILNSEDIFCPSDLRWKAIKNHPQKSVEILKKTGNTFSEEVYKMIEFHHPWYFEKSNNSYFIDGISNEVTLGYQIVSIIDAYIGLRAKRARRKNLHSHDKAMKEINRDVDKGKFPASLVLLLGPVMEESYNKLNNNMN